MKKISRVLFDYDVYPKVFLSKRETTVTIQPLGRHSTFQKDYTYTVRVYKVNQGNSGVYPERNADAPCLQLAPDADGCLRVTASFADEGEY